MPNPRFSRRIENFRCDVCGTEVRGSGYTDHCPNCLYGKHVDVNPGDRASDCGGSMKPIGTIFERDNFTIMYRCQRCGKDKRMKAAAGDNSDLLVKLLQR